MPLPRDGRLPALDGPLLVAGAVSLVLGVALLGLAAVDPVEILGISRWLKPAKFLLSFVAFFWALAVLVPPLGATTTAAVVRWGTIAMMTIEILAIGGQAARGTTSHFNTATPFDNAVFQAMGLAILVNTGLMAALLVAWLRRPAAWDPAVVLGVRLGLLVFLIGSLEGTMMIGRNAHTVGLADGGPGLPLVNWSTVGGDLRIAHFLGLHALQLMPLGALAVTRLLPRGSARMRRTLVAAFAALYVAVMAALFAQAIAGRPFIAA